VHTAEMSPSESGLGNVCLNHEHRKSEDRTDPCELDVALTVRIGDNVNATNDTEYNHITVKKQYTCDKRNELFSSKTYLGLHDNVKAGNQQYICD
jgi:hypothetical protein